MSSHSFRLPWPPSVNSYLQPMTSGRGKYITHKGKAFRRDVAAACHGVEPLPGRLAVHLELAAPDRRRRDIDNHVKATLDALQFAGCFGDDEQIDELIVRRLPVASPGCCDVTITEITPDTEVSDA